MLIVDTGAWLALANRRDKFHQPCREALTALKEPLITTWPVVTETCYLLQSRLGSISQLTFIKSMLKGAFKVYDLGESHFPRILSLMQKYVELPMDLADSSLVILAEELGHGRILSTDRRDFRSYRWKEKKPFDNVLLRFC